MDSTFYNIPNFFGMPRAGQDPIYSLVVGLTFAILNIHMVYSSSCDRACMGSFDPRILDNSLSLLHGN